LAKFIIILSLVAAIFSVLICEGEVESMKNLEVDLGFTQVPVDSACEGRNLSPQIEIHGLNSTSLATIVDDIDSPSGTFTHWRIWSIMPLSLIPSGMPNNLEIATPLKSDSCSNSFDKIGYMGPCPPKGKPHRYYFRIYGLDKMLDLDPGATRQELENAMKGHILQQGEAMALTKDEGITYLRLRITAPLS
jgi:Raf kinase inhibitor-like YbhB/YbcL family protein